nr:MAG: putative RNA-dependent RNA polymerase [Leviviridae sp.]
MDVIPSNVKRLIPRSHESIMTSDLSHQQAALIQLNNSLLKKYMPRGKNKQADKAALDLFLTVNARCALWEPDETSYHYHTMLRARDKLRNRIYSGPLQASRLTLAETLGRLVPGPGSSIGTKNTDFVGKLFHGQLTTYDSSLWEFYRRHVGTMWRLAEEVRRRIHGPCVVVDASRMTFARKNFDISRVINTEANLNMLFQLGMGDIMEDCLEDWFNINLSKQPDINRFLARLGSIDGSYATVDLKSASDCNSRSFMKWFLPPATFNTLSSISAKCIKLPGVEQPVDLNIFSTMGNGFTFPLQTIVFSSIVEAAYEELGLTTFNSGRQPAFSVFGDDIVCVRSAYHKVLSLLEWCGFIVNRDKSFNDGSFRESCGRDYYKGRDVRGVYIKKLHHETHYYSVFNALSRWAVVHGVDLGPVLRYLKGLVVFRPVPFDAADSAGIKCPLSLSGLHANKFGLVRYKFYAPVPRRRSTKAYETNPFALNVAAVGGYLEGTGTKPGGIKGIFQFDSLWKPFPGQTPTGQITLRDKPDGDPQVKLKCELTSSWDWVPHKGLIALDYFRMLYDVILP